MALDIRLACLRDAILENWADLETEDVNGTLVVRLKKGAAANGMGKALKGKKPGNWMESNGPD